MKLKIIFATIVTWFVLMYVFNKTYREMKKEIPELAELERRLWGLIFFAWIILIIMLLVTNHMGWWSFYG